MLQKIINRLSVESEEFFNPIAFRTAKTLQGFGHSGCNRVNNLEGDECFEEREKVCYTENLQEEGCVIQSVGEGERICNNKK